MRGAARIVLIGFLAVMALALWASASRAHIANHPEWDEWFAEQQRPDGSELSCCNKSDAYLLDDDDVRIVDGEYEVKTAGGWLRFPNAGQGKPGNTVMGYVRNPTGHAVAWYIGSVPLCFTDGIRA